MKIWQLTIATEELGDNVEVINGLAPNGKEAIEKGEVCAIERYADFSHFSKVIEIGDVDFT